MTGELVTGSDNGAAWQARAGTRQHGAGHGEHQGRGGGRRTGNGLRPQGSSPRSHRMRARREALLVRARASERHGDGRSELGAAGEGSRGQTRAMARELGRIKSRRWEQGRRAGHRTEAELEPGATREGLGWASTGKRWREREARGGCAMAGTQQGEEARVTHTTG
jgi:hypothetical protein